MNTAIFAAIIAIPLASAPLTAIAAAPVDNFGANVQYERTIVRLTSQLDRQPNDEAAMLNLAVALRHTGRIAESRDMFRRVLQLEEVELDTEQGIVLSSHQIARRGLGQVTQLSAR